MADGSIEFSTTLDNSDLEKKLVDAERRVDELKKKVESKTTERNEIAEKMQEAAIEINKASQRVDELKERIESLKSSDDPFAGARIGVNEEALAKAEKDLDKQLNAGVKLAEQYNTLEKEVNDYTLSLKNAEAEYRNLGAEAQQEAARQSSVFARASNGIRNGFASISANAKSSFSQLGRTVTSPFETLEKKLTGALKKVFVFSMILKGVRALKNELSSMLSENKQFNASVENLKAVLRGFLSSFVQALLPALIAFVNMLSAIFERIAGLIDSVFGTGILAAIQSQRDQASAEIQAANAEKLSNATNKQAKAAKKLAKEQKKANRQIASFDELNVLAAESSADMAEAAENTGLGNTGLGNPDLQSDWTKSLMPDTGMFQGVLNWLDELKNRILNDVEGPFARIRDGLEKIREGWGKVVEGFRTGNLGLIWEGIADIISGAVYVIDGTFGVLMDWLDELTGYQYTDIFQGLELAFHGISEMIDGLLHGDLELFRQGFFDFFDGIGQTAYGSIKSVVDSASGLFVMFIDESVSRWSTFLDELSKRFPQFKAAFDGLKTFIVGGLGTLKGAVQGLANFINSTVKGLTDGLSSIIKGLFDVVVGLFTGNTGTIANGLKAIVNGIIDIINGFIKGVVDGAIGMLNGIINTVNTIPGINFGQASATAPQIPHLAGGAVIPPNREFMAVLGDQSSGRNIEAPESLIRQIVREESGLDAATMQAAITSALVQALPSILKSGESDSDVVMNIDGREVMRALVPHIDSMVRSGEWNPEFF